MSNTRPAETTPPSALQALVNREEVLQICYWYQGEGFGRTYDAAILKPFLNCRIEDIDHALRELADAGHLAAADQPARGYRFTEAGRRAAGRLFAEGFADYQKPGHGECVDGCCDDDDHSQCGDNCSLH